MNLRCKKGDLAIILRGSTFGNDGKIVEVMEFLGTVRLARGGVFDNVWRISIAGEEINPLGSYWACPDSYLLPIRPGDLKETEETEKKVEIV